MSYENTKLVDCNLEEFAKALTTGNGFGQESLWIKGYLEGSKYSTVEETITPYLHNVCQFVMDDFFTDRGYKKIKEAFHDDSGEVSATFETIEVNLNEHKKVYKNAFVVYEKSKDDRIIVSINNFGPNEIIYRIYAKDTSVLENWMKYARENNFYKNKKIDAGCRFLELGDTSWEDLVLPKETQDVIQSRVNELFDMKDFLDANKIPLKGGVILAGPPGTGKTVICKILARELKHTVIYAMPDHLGRTSDIKRVCEMAKDLAPSILIIEDIDYIAEERDHSRNAGGVIELMNYLDGVQEFNNVITLATTNEQDKIEKALSNRPGRFDRVVQVPKPNAECRRRMLGTFSSNYKLKGEIDWDLLIKKTDGLSGAHVKDLCKTAAIHAGRDGSYNKKTKQAIITMDHFKSALNEVANVDYSTYHKAQNKRKKMGFAEELDW